VGTTPGAAGEPSPRATESAELTTRIARVFVTSRRTYGSPRIHRALRQAGVRCGVNRVAPNRLGRAFCARQLNEKWAADITHVWTRSGWLYLAVVLDLASRRVVGWAMERRPDASLPVKALTMALRARRPAAGLLCHSDQGRVRSLTRRRYHQQSRPRLTSIAHHEPTPTPLLNCPRNWGKSKHPHISIFSGGYAYHEIG